MNNKNPVNLAIILIHIVLMFISCEQTVSTSPPIDPVPLGFIYIESSPPGMKIYEDGRNSGKVTPDSLNWLDEREYAITLKKKLFIDYYSNPQMFGGLE